MRVLVLFVTVLLAAPALGANLDIVVAVPDDPLHAGEQMVFSVHFHNAADEPVRIDLPRRVTCRLMTADQTVKVSADSLELREEGEFPLPKRFMFPEFGCLRILGYCWPRSRS